MLPGCIGGRSGSGRAGPGRAGSGWCMHQTGQYKPHVVGCARRPHESERGRGVRGGPGTNPIQIRPDLNIQAKGGPSSNSPNPDHPKVTLWSRRRQMTRRHRRGRKWNQLQRCSIQERRTRNCLVESRRKTVLVQCRKGRIVFFGGVEREKEVQVWWECGVYWFLPSGQSQKQTQAE